MVLRPGYSTVNPVHHLVKVEKSKLRPGLKELLLPKDDIRSVKFKPTEISQDRVNEYYQNALQSDLLLHLYEHDAEPIIGNKKRSWGTDTPLNCTVHCENQLEVQDQRKIFIQ